MERTIRPWVENWAMLDERFWAVIQVVRRGLTPEEVCWKPSPRINSIGWNLQHLAEMLDYYLHVLFGLGEPLRAEHPTMRRNAVDDGRYSDVDEIAAYHRAVRPVYRRYLENLSLEDLEQTAPRGGMTIGWAIGHIHEHESYHLGKCTLLLRWIVDSRRRT